MKKESRREHNPVLASSDEASQKAHLLAPLEEQRTRNQSANTNNGGMINVDTGNLNLPTDLTERDDKESHILGLEPLALIILIFALAFIAFITYLIAIEPPTTGPQPAPTGEVQHRRPLREAHEQNHAFSA